MTIIFIFSWNSRGVETSILSSIKFITVLSEINYPDFWQSYPPPPVFWPRELLKEKRQNIYS